MKTLAVTAVCAATLLGCAQPKAQQVSDLKTSTEKVSYIIGLQMGRSFKDQGITVTPEIVLQGLRDALGDGKPLLTDQQIQTVMTEFQSEMVAKAHLRDSASAITNTKEGEAFLAANKSKDGVQATASGLQYKVLKAGSGPKPTASNTVTVNYRGTLLNGDEFDKSQQGPVTFPLRSVIPGWTEGLQLMNAGAKYQFVIPAKLAYGEAGSPPKIGPNATLIFEVELISFK
jgi:FKBP-type peptidyl-prolyl cis-trans isomerase FklB